MTASCPSALYASTCSAAPTTRSTTLASDFDQPLLMMWDEMSVTVNTAASAERCPIAPLPAVSAILTKASVAVAPAAARDGPGQDHPWMKSLSQRRL